MADLQAILRELDELEPEELDQLRNYIDQRRTPPKQRKKRILGLHPGAITTTDDFDDPLPDEFWLGEESAS